MTTNLPTSEQSGNLDNISVTRAEFREQIGVLLEYLAQTLGNVSGTYTSEVVNPEQPILSGAPTIDLDAVPATGDNTTRIPSTSWVKRSGRYVGGTAPSIPQDGMLWVDNSTQPYQLKVFDQTDNAWDLLSGVPAGTVMLFQQSAAPVGWTKLTSHDNKALRVVSGGVSSGGNLTFTSAFSSRGTSGSVAGTGLSVAQMPTHSHGISQSPHSHSASVSDPGHAHSFRAAEASGSSSSGGGDNDAFNRDKVTSRATTGIGVGVNANSISISVQNNGSGAAHSHGFSGSNIDMRVQYVDVIFARRN